MKNDARLWLVSGLFFVQCVVVSGCRSSYLTMKECEEQLAEFPPAREVVSNEAKATIAPLGADALVGSWQGEYTYRYETYDGRMARSNYIGLSGRTMEKYEFLANGIFMFTRETRDNGSLAYSVKYGENVGKVIHKFTGRWDYSNGRLTLSMDGKGSFDGWGLFGESYHRDITSLREILPANIYIVDWFSDQEILFMNDSQGRSYTSHDNYLSYNAKSMSTEVSYDEFGRECAISRVIRETKNGEDYGYISVTLTGSKILRKIK